MNSTGSRTQLLVAVIFLAVVAGVRAQGPVDFLRRVDENGNGMLDPNELEGRMGSFVRRMAENNPRIDLSRPIPLDRLASEFERMREERSRGGGDGRSGGPGFGGGPPFGGGPSFGGGPGFGGGPPSGGDWRGGDRDRGSSDNNQSSPYSSRETKIEPLVPGFGVASMSTPPPGFGAEAQLFTIEVTEEDRREAERSFRYYDRNQDGKIDSEEMGRSRYGSDLPVFDKNRDGVLTLNEMEYRYARRRIDNTQDDRTRSRSSGDDRRGGDDRRRGGDGEEQAGSPEAAANDLKSYRRKPPIERLPEGMPEWFARDDADGDGQVAMKEFSVSWTDAVLAEFHQFDMNRDGLITPQECLAAKNQGAIRGASIGGSGSSPPPASSPAAGMAVAVAPEAAAAAADVPAASAPAPGSTPSSGASPAAAKVDPKYYDYFKKVVIKYDTNNDGELTPNEWASMSKNPEAADADRNGRITIDEYARWSLQR